LTFVFEPAVAVPVSVIVTPEMGNSPESKTPLL